MIELSRNVLNNIHTLITRFIQLREQSSEYDENHNVKPTYLEQPFKHFENLKPMVQPKESPGVETKTVQVPQDNLIVIDEMTGETIPPITKYDYDDSYSFREKDKK